MSLLLDDDPRATAADQVEAWRLEQLIKAGYRVSLAERVAARPDVDLHQAADLVLGGCDDETAVRILL